MTDHHIHEQEASRGMAPAAFIAALEQEAGLAAADTTLGLAAASLARLDEAQQTPLNIRSTLEAIFPVLRESNSWQYLAALRAPGLLTPDEVERLQQVRAHARSLAVATGSFLRDSRVAAHASLHRGEVVGVLTIREVTSSPAATIPWCQLYIFPRPDGFSLYGVHHYPVDFSEPQTDLVMGVPAMGSAEPASLNLYVGVAARSGYSPSSGA